MQESPDLNQTMSQLRELASQEDTFERRSALVDILGQTIEESWWPVILDYACSHQLLREEHRESMQRQHESVLVHEAWSNPKDQSEMIWIPPGPSTPGFSLSKHPVTNKQFAQFMEETDYDPSPYHRKNEYFLEHWEDDESPEEEADFPVTHVSWFDALHYCKWAGLTLPTVAMWRHAALGTDGRHYPWGNLYSWDYHHALWNGNPVSVHSYPQVRTAFGCQNMFGNVTEWCFVDELPFGDPTHLVIPKEEAFNYQGENKVPVGGYNSYAAKGEDKYRKSDYPRRRGSTKGFRPAFFPTFPQES